VDQEDRRGSQRESLGFGELGAKEKLKLEESRWFLFIN